MDTPEKVIPEGMVEIADGSVIDKADMCTRLRPHPKSDKLFFDRAGKCYCKGDDGTLRRYPPKLSREEKREQKRRRKWSRHE